MPFDSFMKPPNIQLFCQCYWQVYENVLFFYHHRFQINTENPDTYVFSWLNPTDQQDIFRNVFKPFRWGNWTSPPFISQHFSTCCVEDIFNGLILLTPHNRCSCWYCQVPSALTPLWHFQIYQQMTLFLPFRPGVMLTSSRINKDEERERKKKKHFTWVKHSAT